jgi:hypothetical protein
MNKAKSIEELFTEKKSENAYVHHNLAQKI